MLNSHPCAARGYHMGEHRQGTFPSWQKVLLDCSWCRVFPIINKLELCSSPLKIISWTVLDWHGRSKTITIHTQWQRWKLGCRYFIWFKNITFEVLVVRTVISPTEGMFALPGESIRFELSSLNDYILIISLERQYFSWEDIQQTWSKNNPSKASSQI